jgi:signal transduction histidine kinase
MRNILALPWKNWSARYEHLRFDVALALAIAAIEIAVTSFVGQHQPERRAMDAGGVALLAAGAAALAFRSEYPDGVLVFTKIATLLYWLLDYPRGPIFLALIVALFTSMMYGRRLVAWAVLLAGYASFLWLPYVVGVESAPSMPTILILGGWLLLLGAVAEFARVRRERSIESERIRQEEARRHISEERLQIARELHDVLAHNISLINVQAGVALHLIDERPEQARTALSAIKDVSKDTLHEIRSVLDMLRQADQEALRSPSPSLVRVDELISRAESAGLEVQTEIEGDLHDLPASLDLTAFRIVQEALTNVIKHAGQTRATVRITRGEQELTLQIDDYGIGATVQNVAGKGILGMQERAAAIGGTVEVGPRADGGFRVFARLPLNGQ